MDESRAFAQGFQPEFQIFVSMAKMKGNGGRLTRVVGIGPGYPILGPVRGTSGTGPANLLRNLVILSIKTVTFPLLLPSKIKNSKISLNYSLPLHQRMRCK